jgi:UDP-N-acetylglucosamine--N-acetylmuramyl-(pentapeptide) pyrophosphoryl-undecaprenol N-acetylglucosamine transferase
MKQKPVILLMAGGTGGHVFPALAIAQALQEKDFKICWLGTQQGLEARVVPQAGIEIYYINIKGLRGKGMLRLLTAPFKIMLATWQAWRVLRQIRPVAVVGMGGFVSGPGGVAAGLAGIPLLIHEQNAIAGFTNRWLARLARQVMQAFPHTFPDNYHAIHTGNPLRAAIMALREQPKILMQQGIFHILVVGGSLGAQALNEIVPRALQQVHAKIEVIHQTGRNQLATTQQAYATAPFQATVTEFIDEMATAYSWADLVICRAGALTISELAQAGLPSILIPFPHAVDDHQTHNAHFLSDNQAAILLPQPALTVEKLSQLINELANDAPKLAMMSNAAKEAATPQALQQVVAVILGQITHS